MTRLLGRDRLHKRLLALPPAMKAGMTAALVQAANAISELQKALLSNDPKLQAATGWVFGDAQNAVGIIHASGQSLSQAATDDLKITIFSGGPEAYWSHWREFGTAPHSLAPGASRKRGKLQDKGPHHPGERASPYFYGPFRAYKKMAVHNITLAVNAAMRKVASAP